MRAGDNIPPVREAQRAWLRIAAFALACTGLVPVARADDAADCHQQVDPPASIAACTRLISSGLLAPADTQSAYDDRGYSYLKIGDYPRAAGDFSASLKLGIDDDSAFTGRGTARNAQGDY